MDHHFDHLGNASTWVAFPSKSPSFLGRLSILVSDPSGSSSHLGCLSIRVSLPLGSPSHLGRLLFRFAFHSGFRVAFNSGSTSHLGSSFHLSQMCSFSSNCLSGVKVMRLGLIVTSNVWLMAVPLTANTNRIFYLWQAWSQPLNWHAISSCMVWSTERADLDPDLRLGSDIEEVVSRFLDKSFALSWSWHSSFCSEPFKEQLI